MRLARRMLAAGAIRPGGPAYPAVTAYYSSPGGAGDYADASTNVAARAVFGGTGAPVCTVVAWGRTTGVSHWLGIGDAGDNQPWVDVFAAGELDIDVTDAAGNLVESPVSSGPDPGDGSWHSIAAVMDGSELIAYCDAVAGSGTASLGGMTFAAADVARALIDGWLADIGNVAFFSRALSASEVAAIAAAGPSVDVRQVVGTTGLVVYWRDAAVGGVVANVGSGGTCSLTLHGAVTSEAL